jgi:hypothetical protein
MGVGVGEQSARGGGGHTLAREDPMGIFRVNENGPKLQRGFVALLGLDWTAQAGATTRTSSLYVCHYWHVQYRETKLKD